MGKPNRRQREQARRLRRAERRAAQGAAGQAQAKPRASHADPVRGALAPVIDGSRRWYLARTKSRLGPIGRQMLDDALAKGDVAAHRPRASEIVVRQGRRRVRFVPLMPSTLIVGCTDEAHADTVEAMPGVETIVRVAVPDTDAGGNIPGSRYRRAELEAKALQRFFIALAAGEIIQPTGLRVGQQVVVLTGPLADFPGSIEEILANDRVRVAVPLFGASTSVVLGIAELQAV